MARKWSEVGVMEVDFEPEVTTTNTAETWRTWAKQNLLVKVKTASTNAADNGMIVIQRCTATTDVPIGILRSVTGDPSDFPSKFTARVAICAYDCNVDGSATGALADADYGKRFGPATTGKASIVSTGGFGRVVGGDKANLRVAFDFRDNFR